MTKNEVSIEDILREDYRTPESVFDAFRTKTTSFMLPTIFPNNSLVGTEYFINAYIDDAKFSHALERVIFILFRTDRSTKWIMLANKLRSKPEYVLEYFVGIQDERPLVMMIFKVPNRYANEYANFIEGKYSKFSEEYKKLFQRYSTNNKAEPDESMIWQVLYKSEKLKKRLEFYFTVDPKGKNPLEFGPNDELWGIPEPKFEVYRHE